MTEREHEIRRTLTFFLDETADIPQALEESRVKLNEHGLDATPATAHLTRAINELRNARRQAECFLA